MSSLAVSVHKKNIEEARAKREAREARIRQDCAAVQDAATRKIAGTVVGPATAKVMALQKEGVTLVNEFMDVLGRMEAAARADEEAYVELAAHVRMLVEASDSGDANEGSVDIKWKTDLAEGLHSLVEESHAKLYDDYVGRVMKSEATMRAIVAQAQKTIQALEENSAGDSAAMDEDDDMN